MSDETPAPPAPTRRRLRLLLSIAAVVLVVDIATKVLAVELSLDLGHPRLIGCGKVKATVCVRL